VSSGGSEDFFRLGGRRTLPRSSCRKRFCPDSRPGGRFSSRWLCGSWGWPDSGYYAWATAAGRTRVKGPGGCSDTAEIPRRCSSRHRGFYGSRARVAPGKIGCCRPQQVRGATPRGPRLGVVPQLQAQKPARHPAPCRKAQQSKLFAGQTGKTCCKQDFQPSASQSQLGRASITLFRPKGRLAGTCRLDRFCSVAAVGRMETRQPDRFYRFGDSEAAQPSPRSFARVEPRSC